MDPVSLTLGILPLAGGAIKAYSAVRKKLKVYRHYSREVPRLRKRLDRQQDIFHGEIQLLIRACLDDKSAFARMIDDPTDPEWQSKELDKQLRVHLHNSYGSCQETIEDVGNTINDLELDLECFEELSGEPLKDAACRLRNKVKVAWNKGKFEDYIKSLRDSNSDLRLLREQASEIQNVGSRSAPVYHHQKRLAQEFGEFRTIRRASKALHHALTAAWSISASNANDEETKHNVRLFVDAKVQGEVRMDMAVLCYGHSTKGDHLIQPVLQRLQVRSQVLDWMQSGLNTPPGLDEGRQKRRKVRFTDDCSTTECPIASAPKASPLTPEDPNTHLTDFDDLSSKDFCSVLRKGKSRISNTGSWCCLGYIDSCSEQTFRHLFYQDLLETPAQPAIRCRLETQALISMDKVLDQPVETSVSIVDQLKLARKMVAAVLKFYSTPWLNQYFTISDVSFFKSGVDFAQSLQTLHFGLDFTRKQCMTCSVFTMEGVEATPSDTSTAMLTAFEDAKLQYGVRNITLWSLGTILLQVGRWSTIGAPDDVLTIRKLSSQAPALGPRYQELTKRCLECDFGYGEDLSKPRLQQAVYESVFCELSDMISSLDIND